MNPSGLHINKPVAAVIVVGVVVSAYLWFQYYSSRSTVELKMDKVNAAKTSVDAVKVHHETKLSFKVGDKDVTIAYREVKPDKPVLDILFLHGMRFKSETWVSAPVKTLQLMYNLNYRAIAIDLPGYGDSPSADVDKAQFIGAVISELHLDRPVIVSPSMSGSFALPYLLSDPSNALKKCKGYVPVAPVQTDQYQKEIYEQFKVPTLIIYGEKDTGIGQESLKNLQQVPNKTLVELPDAGHACYLDKPDEFHKNLFSFLSSLKN